MYRTVILLGAALSFTSSASADALVPWPAEAKANAAGVCKANIRESVAHDYLAMTDSTELPADFYQKAAPNLNPQFAACDCALNKLEKQFGYDYYSAHPDDMPARILGLAVGACKQKPRTEDDAAP